ncbi:peptide chain release factor N(5)-glutamine methyltransferase [uncultured Desulfobulbus sp.]|uniref:peptide chain release factor N(5)-glutamine methyltransferase n=1 Tax=uncultured Desulfobulbus sp. TaxID=239745 RepID=UPI0029C612F3|nr:peptide chain release factor N(5)-glutamine methyltransferase [uncultured Desulfobulbus sp.]
MRIDELLAAAARDLSLAGIGEAAIDARLLLQHLTGLNRSQLLLHGDAVLDERTFERYQNLITERSHRIPLQHLIGSQEFWSMDFAVSPAVLIPRPETEFLLEQVLATCSGTLSTEALDMCTGSGVIAVVLAKELGCPVVAVDISETALRVAVKNFSRHQVAEQIQPVCSDLFAALASNQKFDLIVSNPPYIAEEQIDRLEPEVCRSEPRLALSGGPGGMKIIERIASEAHLFLQPGGWLFLEIGADQRKAVGTLFRLLAPHYSEVRVIDDWAGRPRVVQARHVPK